MPVTAATELPATPRPVRWRAALRHRWPLGLLAGAWLLVGLVVLAITLASGMDVVPLADDALDADHAIAEGEVLEVRSTGFHWGRDDFVAVRYRFSPSDDRVLVGESFTTRAEAPASGTPIRVEYVPSDPTIHRAAGTRRNPFRWFHSVFVGLYVIPGVIALLWWLRGVTRMRVVLGYGRAVPARVLETRPVRLVNPPQQRVRYRFTDHLGEVREGTQWVGARGSIAEQLAAGVATVLIVHDEADPGWHRITSADDYHA